MKYLECVIESGLLSEVRKTEYIDVFEELRVTGVNMLKGDVIFCEDDPVDKICIIKSGSVRGEKAYSTGELHIIDFHEQGRMFALEEAVSKLRTAAMDYVCNEDSTIVFIPLSAVLKSKCSAEIMAFIMQRLADESIRKMHKIEILAERGLRDRIIMYLDILRKKSGTNVVRVNMGREQLAQFLFKYAQYNGLSAVTLAENLSSFADNDAISAYAIPALQWAVGQGFLNGTDGKLLPAGTATRCQFAAILNRFCAAQTAA